MTTVDPLFDEPARRRFGLSQRHASAAGPAQYRRAASRQPCDECFALQHETSGAWGSRAPVRHARDGGGRTLLLCAPHAELWRERDAA